LFKNVTLDLKWSVKFTQYKFANYGRSYQHWEIVELRVPVPLLEIAEENEKILEELVEYVYEESDDYALHHVEIRPQVIDTPDEVTEHNVVFDAIQDEVIQGIRDAKFIQKARRVKWPHVIRSDKPYRQLPPDSCFRLSK